MAQPRGSRFGPGKERRRVGVRDSDPPQVRSGLELPVTAILWTDNARNSARAGEALDRRGWRDRRIGRAKTLRRQAEA